MLKLIEVNCQSDGVTRIMHATGDDPAVAFGDLVAATCMVASFLKIPVEQITAGIEATMPVATRHMAELEQNADAILAALRKASPDA